MEYLTLMFFIVLSMAVVMEMVDSSLGMMYGTVLSPLLIGIGFSPIDVVPALVLSQALGGVVASFRHDYFRNASLFNCKSKDLKVAFMIFALGIVAVVVGTLTGVKMSKFALSLYISILMLVMGIIVFAGIKLRFSWNRILVIGLISSFNKALSGGGFGPIVTSGQLIVNRSGKRSVGATTMSEVIVCFASFVAWIIVSRRIPSIELIVALCVGAMIGGFIGPYILSKVGNNKTLVKVVGALAIVSGIFALIKTLT